MQVTLEKCKGCGTCVLDCPQGAIKLVEKKAVIGDTCSECKACLRVCPEEALFSEDAPVPGAVTCEACPVRCRIKEGYTGACQRFMNRDGFLERTISLKTYDEVKHLVGPDWQPAIRQPLITGIGAGTTYPDCKPAPHIVHSKVDGIDVVTVVTEAPLSYSGIKIKIDTDSNIGQEGAPIIYRKKRVGHLSTEEYGSKMLSLGGVNLLTGPDGLSVARLISDLANRKNVRLRVEGGSRLELQVGKRPVIDGTTDDVMRVGCGSATLGLFAGLFREVADEVIVLDSHLTGLMSEHAAGLYVGVHPSGVRLRFKRSTPGRYFGDHGNGWGGTSIVDPRDIIESIDMKTARPGMKIMITETTGRKAVMFRVTGNGDLEQIEMTHPARKAIAELADTCQESRVSAVYCGGSGGSARAGVTRYPIKLTRAVHSMKAKLTVGGAATFVLPGGGINFMVDVEKVMPGAFTWVPTPATVCPIEYTMTVEDYLEMGGHEEAMKPFHVKE
ncbi:MAG TPA: 4Fe-4S dicluster domain-containing protein [Desulfomonilaceae bacterium]|nr:4Fe-4S dicluster domain-containing protein [Desulfomonilaceae bacterium]